MSFVHLHNHSYYSLLQSPTSPELLAKTAKEQGSSAIALTDNGVMYGAIEFYKACKKHEIKPIIGMEAYIAPRSLYKKEFKSDGRPWTLVLLAETQEGYQNLLKLSSIAHMEGMYYKPRIDLEVLEKHKKGLIALSGGFSGEIPHAILEGYLDEDIEKAIKKYLDIFGKNHFFFELSYHPNLPGQFELNEKLTELGGKFKVETVVAQNAYYSSPDDAEAQDILSCIAMNRQVDDDNRSTMIDEDYSLTAPEEIIPTFENNKKAIENTVKIADRCKIDFDFGAYHIPDLNPPKEHSTKTPLDYFRYECIEGLKERYPQFKKYLEEIGWNNLKCKIQNSKSSLSSLTPIGDPNKSDLSSNSEELDSGQSLSHSRSDGNDNEDNHSNEQNSPDKTFSGAEIAERFEYEFGIIKKMGFESYFLMVWDYIKWAKDNGIMVGPGRGSGAGSIIAYALKITDLEPLQYSLLFERFLNPERVSMPDFDVDFQDNRINEVLDYVSKKYGEDHVARICTFGTLAARAAVKDVGRAMGIPFEKMNMFSKLIPERPGTKLAEAWESEPILKDTVENDEELQKIWDISLKLEGCVRHISVHACGVVISPEPLEKYSAIQHPPKDSSSVISQFSGKPLESLGLLKMDFLGLKNLSILDTAVKIIKRTKGTNIELDKIPVTDEKTFEVFQNAQTTGVFQFESAGMKRYLKELKPTVFEDLIAMNSLYRPGPMEFIPDFIKRKHGKVHIAYPHKSLEDILKPTYGIAVYQEQILQMAQAYAGYSLGQADILRRAIGKKIAEEMDKQRKVFLEKAESLGREKKTSEYIFDKVIVPFAGYGFNKSHAAAYSLIAYQTAYLKAHFRTEFMAALLSADQSNSERVAIEIEECRSMEIEILPPSVNDSLHDFTVVKSRQIRFGLSAIKNLGDSGIDAIIQARGKDEIKFQNLEDFLKRVEASQLNRKNLEALICSGAMDELGERKAMLLSMDEMVEFAKESHMQTSTGQMGLFDGGTQSEAVSLRLQKTEAAGLMQQLQWEKEFLGLFVSAHPLASISPYLHKHYTPLSSLEAKSIGKVGKFAGLITNLRKIKTKKGDYMATFSLDTPSGKIDVAVFPRVYNENIKKIEDDYFLLVEGKIDLRNDMLQIIAEKIFHKKLDDVLEKAKKEKLFDESIKYVKNEGAPSISMEDVENEKKQAWHLEIPPKASKEALLSLKKIFENNPGNDEVVLVFPNKQRMPLPAKVKLTKILKGNIRQLLHS